MYDEVHAVGNMVDVSAFPRLVVMRRSSSFFEQCPMVIEYLKARAPVWFINPSNQFFNGSIGKFGVGNSHRFLRGQRTVASIIAL
jgi:hypothetical protein